MKANGDRANPIRREGNQIWDCLRLTTVFFILKADIKKMADSAGPQSFVEVLHKRNHFRTIKN